MTLSLGRIPLSIEFAILFCALLGLIWAYFLFTHKRGNPQANKYLGVLIVSLSLLILRQVVRINEAQTFTQFVYFFSQGIVFLIGPAFYFHIKRLANQQSNRQFEWLHFLPAFIVFCMMTYLFVIRIELNEFKNLILFKIVLFCFVAIQIIHLFIYLFNSKRLVKTFEDFHKQYFSSLTNINLKWIKRLMLITTVFNVVILAMYLLILSGGYYHINNTADFLFLVLISILIFSIIIHTWRQPEIVSGLYKEKNKYKTSPLTPSLTRELKKQLTHLMDHDKIYLTKELNINDIASKLEVQAYIVSQLINQEFNLSFFNFINTYRITFAAEAIRHGILRSTTLEGLAFDAGFNSKSTFNRAFKKKMGCTPKEFAKNQK